MPLERQTAIEAARHAPGKRDAAELVVPADVNTLVVRVQLDDAEWLTKGNEIVFGIERFDGKEWAHVVSAGMVTDGSRPINRDGSPLSQLSLRQMLQLTRKVDGHDVKADDFVWAGQAVRPFVKTTHPTRYAATIEGQMLTDKVRDETSLERTGMEIP